MLFLHDPPAPCRPKKTMYASVVLSMVAALCLTAMTVHLMWADHDSFADNAFL